jgi:hypothetical protein
MMRIARGGPVLITRSNSVLAANDRCLSAPTLSKGIALRSGTRTDSHKLPIESLDCR